MIIDMLSHIGVKKGEDYKVEALLEIMDQAKVEKCMICSTAIARKSSFTRRRTSMFP